jgi:hypothetical protein
LKQYKPWFDKNLQDFRSRELGENYRIKTETKLII